MTLTQAFTIDNGEEKLTYEAEEFNVADFVFMLKSSRLWVIFQELFRLF